MRIRLDDTLLSVARGLHHPSGELGAGGVAGEGDGGGGGGGGAVAWAFKLDSGAFFVILEWGSIEPIVEFMQQGQCSSAVIIKYVQQEYIKKVVSTYVPKIMLTNSPGTGGEI